MDVRTINNSQDNRSNDEYVEMIRQQLGSDFTANKVAGKKGRNEMGKDDFMKLMTAQLKHQDPINPMKNEQMAAQLAQFSALEQMMNVNQNLEKMAAGQKPTEHVLAASLIGKKVVSDSANFNYDKKSEPTLKFELPTNVNELSLSVVNQRGEIVREVKMSAMPKGPQSIKWDGKDEKGNLVQPGEYSFRVSARDEKGKSVEAKTSTAGTVDGVVFEGGKPLLIVGDKKLPIDAVGRIENDAPAISADKENSLAANSLAKNQSDKQNLSNENVKSSSAQNLKKNDASQEKNLNAEQEVETMKNMQGTSGEVAQSNTSQNAQASTTGSNSGAVSQNEQPYPLWNPASL